MSEVLQMPNPENMHPDLSAVVLAIKEYGLENNLTPAELASIFHDGIAVQACRLDMEISALDGRSSHLGGATADGTHFP